MPRHGSGDNIAAGRLQLENAEFRQRQWEHSPDYIDKLHRDQLSRELMRQRLEKEQGTSQAQMFGDQQRQNIALKAQMDAVLLEKRYTAKQLAEIAHWKQVPANAAASGMYDEEQLRRISEFAKMREMGIQPQDMPRLSKHPQGQDVGQYWQDEQGVGWYRTENGEAKPYDWSKTKPGMEMQHQLEATKEKAKLDVKREEIKEKYRLDLLKQQVPDSDPNNKRGTRYLTPQEIQEQMERAFPDPESVERQRVARMRQEAGLGPVNESAGVVKITSNDEYKKLSSGTEFIGPDGKLRRKP